MATIQAQHPSPHDDQSLLSFILDQGWFPRSFAKHPALLRLWLPLYLADCKAVTSYAYAFDDATVPCPILCVGSSSPGEAGGCSMHDLKEWGERTSRKVEVVVVDGGRNYWSVRREEVMRCLAMRVEGYLEAYWERQRAKAGGESESEESEEEEWEEDSIEGGGSPKGGEG